MLFVGHLRDLSSTKQAEAQLLTSRRQAEASNQAKSYFLANMSHELRTPMTAIIGFADMLRRQPDHAQRADWIQQIHASGEYLLALVNDLLDLSKIEAGEVTLEQLTVSPLAVLNSVEQFMAPLADAKGLALVLEGRGEVPEAIQCDPVRLRQILLNLVGNAIKFTARGSVRIVVWHEPADSEARSCLYVEVQDTGPGIAPDELERIFERFSRARAGAVRAEGAGLGLEISQRLAQLLGGEITVRSQLGEGSCFTFALPLQGIGGDSLVDTQVHDIRAFATAPTPEVDLTGVRILVVDDHPPNRMLMRALLEDRGAVVEEAGDGEAGVRLALQRSEAGAAHDVVVMDMRMPTLDGYGATRQLREAGYRRPVIALTASAMAGDEARCLDAGCDAYLSKPLNPPHLLATLDRMLGVPEDRSTTRHFRYAVQPKPKPVEKPAVDPRLQALFDAYARDLPLTAAELAALAQAGDADGVGRLAHRLAGTAASFGFPEVSELARAVMNALRQGADLDAVDDDLQTLITTLRFAVVSGETDASAST